MLFNTVLKKFTYGNMIRLRELLLSNAPLALRVFPHTQPHTWLEIARGDTKKSKWLEMDLEEVDGIQLTAQRF